MIRIFTILMMMTLPLQLVTIQGVVDIIQNKTESAISWMEENNMIANSDKFKAIIITEIYELNFKCISISSSAKVDLLGITIDNELSFEFHISEICTDVK